jgi:hypothetical protein
MESDMATSNELSEARALLKELLQTQPNLLAGKGSEQGADVANFCIDFIHTFAEYLGKRAERHLPRQS